MAPVQTVEIDTNHNNNTDSNNQSLTASFQSNGDHLVEEQQVQLEEQQEEQQSTQSIDQRDTFSVNQQQQQEEGEIELGQIRSHGNENTNEHEEEEGGDIRELSMNINTNTDTDINMTMDTDISLNSSSASSDEDITHEHDHEHDDNDDATTQMTEINISQTASNDDTYYDNIHLNNINTNMNNLLWTEEERNSYQQRRRESLGIELNRIQRSNCIHFSILCSIPLALIAIVLFNSLSDDSPCVGFENVICERNERSFLNAFGNKCVCYAFTL